MTDSIALLKTRANLPTPASLIGRKRKDERLWFLGVERSLPSRKRARRPDSADQRATYVIPH